MMKPKVGEIRWSAFVGDDGQCYSSPQRVKVASVNGVVCKVHEKTSYGWSNWLALRNVKDLFQTERDGWLYLASQFPGNGHRDYFESRARLLEIEKGTK